MAKKEPEPEELFLYRRLDLPIIMFPYTEKQANKMIKQGVPLAKAKAEDE